MPTLLLLRHAKSSWDEADLSDHDRPLADRGREAAPRMGAYIAQNGLRPDHVMCSTARRTKDTLSLLLPYLTPKPAVTFDERLYLAEADALLARIVALDDTAQRVMFIGHNPGFEDLARLLAGRGAARDLEQLHRKLPTAALAVIEFEGPAWRNVAPGRGRLVRFATPRGLAAQPDQQG